MNTARSLIQATNVSVLAIGLGNYGNDQSEKKIPQKKNRQTENPSPVGARRLF